MMLIALGGNALDVDEKIHFEQRAELTIAQKTMKNIADLVELGYKDLIISHGNGPQVGKIFLQQELTKDVYKRQAPLDYCVADTQGRLGHLLTEALLNESQKKSLQISTTAIVTHVEVESDDPAFTNPTKPIGQYYSEAESVKITKEKNWVMREEINKGYRRVVPSPTPQKIVEIDIIKNLSKSGTIVIAGGGGGVPIIKEDNQYKGIEAVIDKDKTSALMALQSGVETFVVLTAASQVYTHFGQPDQRGFSKLTVSELKELQKQGHFPPGSMGPKIEAVINFLDGGGKEAYIGNLFELKDIVSGKAGTKIVP